MFFLNREGLQQLWAHVNSQINKKANKNKTELTSYLTDELAKRTQALVDNVVEKVPIVKVAESPTFVDSKDEMTDTSKM